MVRFPRLLAFVIVLLSSVPAFAMPQFLDMYRSDPFRNPNVDGCNTCHMSPQGGDARNAFGQAFESGGEQITPMLRAQFPDRFVYPTSRSNTLTIHFSDPQNRQIVVEAGGMKTLVDAAAKAVNGTPAAAPNAPAPAPSSAALVSERPRIPVDAYAREGAFFGSNIVNLPDGKPMRKGEVDFLVQHRFRQDVKAAGVGNLGGLDSSAFITFGGMVGLTNRLSFGIFRSSYGLNALDRTPIELNTAFQVSRQGDRTPVTIQARAGVDGSRNFHSLYRPFLQVVATRTFADRLSVSLVPTFAFNTRDDERIQPLTFGTEHKNTQSLGVGLGIRLLPTTSIVGEYIPRLHGFRGENKDYAGLSVGLQKSTARHTFELVVGRQEAMTTAQYAYQGVDTFRVGFNIFRRIR